MDQDVKEVVGTLMRALNGSNISCVEVEDLAFEATGDLQTAVNEAYIKLLEYAYDCDANENDWNPDDTLHHELEQCLIRIVELAEPSVGR